MKRLLWTTRILAVLLTLGILFVTVGCFDQAFAEEKAASTTTKDQAIVDGVLAEFQGIASIPHQSHHEEQISEYLYQWAQSRNYQVVKDEQNNIIFDVPATEGYENVPLVVLQGHMDMVVAVADGKGFDPTRDTITLVREGNILRADGTSLGADDGIGVSCILYYIQSGAVHGPLRVIITTNEEDGMTGAYGLSAEYLQGAVYLINMDYENSVEVCTSSAAGTMVHFSFVPKTAPVTKAQAYTISIAGLTSGHSGMDIDKGRLNGIKALAAVLKKLDDEKIDFELASFTGGSARNAIPASASVCIVITAEDEARLEGITAASLQELQIQYAATDPQLQMKLSKTELPQKVFDAETKAAIIRFGFELFDGVNTMSAKIAGLVESSSNLGLIQFVADDTAECTADTYIRSSDPSRQTELTNDQVALAETCGMKTQIDETASAWPVNTNSKLLEIVKAAYLEESGEQIHEVQVHAGLETGTFYELNPELDMVSIGPDIKDPHTIHESCDLATLPKVYRVLEKTLFAIADGQ